MAHQERNEVGEYAKGSGEGGRHHAFHGDQLGGVGGGGKRARRNARGGKARQDFGGYEHGGSGIQPGACREGAGKRRRPGGRASFRKRDHFAGRQAFGDGGRAQGNLRESEAAAA